MAIMIASPDHQLSSAGHEVELGAGRERRSLSVVGHGLGEGGGVH